MSDYRSRKEARRQAFARNFGVKLIDCVACNGSGYYDHNGSPPCGSCGGSGKERGKLNVLPTDPVPAPYTWREQLQYKTRLRDAKRSRNRGSV